MNERKRCGVLVYFIYVYFSAVIDASKAVICKQVLVQFWQTKFTYLGTYLVTFFKNMHLITFQFWRLEIIGAYLKYYLNPLQHFITLMQISSNFANSRHDEIFPVDVQGLNEVDELRLASVCVFINELLSGQWRSHISRVLITHTASLLPPSPHHSPDSHVADFKLAFYQMLIPDFFETLGSNVIN